MASKKNSGASEHDDDGHFENEPSSLDESTHAELIVLYEESAEAIQFAKKNQWGTVGATLLMFGGLIFVANFAPPGKTLANQLSASSILMACAAILILVVYQFWQYNEARKLNFISKQFSSLFREIRALKSSREANIHRYTFLVFMIGMIILGAIITNLGIAKIMIRY
ncbi:MAG: hypothetical protein HON65_12480 [Rhodospirillales bacterium]|jgi:hypothetical protein|nr:hypothetical protein [Rhodospirillales bacterium]